MAAKDFENPIDIANAQTQITGNDNIYQIGITATDSDNNTATTNWSVKVKDVVEEADFTIDTIENAEVDENSSYEVTLEFTGDEPIGTVTYTLSGGADKDLFSIDTETGVVTMQAKDFENPEDADENSVYQIEITATDSDNNTATTNWSVEVKDVVERADFTIDTIENAEVDENSSYEVTLEFTGDEPIGTVTYTLEGADKDLFSIDSSNRSSYYAG